MQMKLFSCFRRKFDFTLLSSLSLHNWRPLLNNLFISFAVFKFHKFRGYCFQMSLGMLFNILIYAKIHALFASIKYQLWHPYIAMFYSGFLNKLHELKFKWKKMKLV